MKIGIYQMSVPGWVLEAGNHLGSLRNLNGYHLNKNPNFDRGTDQNFKGHIEGITGEFLFAIFLERKNRPYCMNKILGLNKDADFVVTLKTEETVKVDVKAITNQKVFNINKTAHQRKPVDLYALIQYGQSEAKIIVIPYKEIETWKSKGELNNQYYSKPINEILNKQHHEKN